MFNRYIPLLRHVIAILLGLILAQVFHIALHSQFNVHPDEYGHFVATNYYENHWIEDRIDSPSMVQTLIPEWGLSYLYLNDLVYFLKNKTTAIIAQIVHDEHIRYRLFNVALLCLLFLLLRPNRWIDTVFLITIVLSPQVWYIFTYINGDALSLVACTLVGLHFARHSSAITASFFKGEWTNRELVIFIAGCACLLFVRLHYLLLIPFFVTCIITLGLRSQPKSTYSAGFRSLLILSSILACIYGADALASEYINDFEKSKLLAQVRLAHASPHLSKEVILATGHNPLGMYAREAGVTLIDFLLRYDWFAGSLRSLIGLYGYMNKPSSDWFYITWMLLVLVPMSGLVVASLLTSANNSRQKCILVVSIIFVFLTVAQSIAHSWIYAAQAQGRYLFATLPIVGTACALSARLLPWSMIYLWIAIVMVFNIIGFYLYAVRAF